MMSSDDSLSADINRYVNSKIGIFFIELSERVMVGIMEGPNEAPWE